jgi:hypothetical protein
VAVAVEVRVGVGLGVAWLVGEAVGLSQGVREGVAVKCGEAVGVGASSLAGEQAPNRTETIRTIKEKGCTFNSHSTGRG